MHEFENPDLKQCFPNYTPQTLTCKTSNLQEKKKIEFGSQEGVRNAVNFPGDSVKNPPTKAGDPGFDPWVGKIPKEEMATH